MSMQGLKPLEDSESSDWEYEYDDIETESFYITVDLSSAPLHRATKKQKTRDDKANNQPATKGPNNAATQTTNEAESSTTQVEGTPVETDTTTQINPSTTPEPEDRIQILDLHTRNPIISYQDHIYACQWTSTLGTDILLTAPDPPPPFPPLYSAPGFHILATPTVKLIGQPVQLVSRLNPLDRSSAPATSTISTESAVPPTSTETPPNTTSVHPPAPAPISVDAASSRTRHNQAHFLSRLVAAKAAKGESDNVTIHSRRRVTGTGWRSWGDTPVLAETSSQDPLASHSPATRTPYKTSLESYEVATPSPSKRKTGRPRGAKTRMEKRKAGRMAGGLFRDYVPEEGDEVGADIRGTGKGKEKEVVGSTPLRWQNVGDWGEKILEGLGEVLLRGVVLGLMAVQEMGKSLKWRIGTTD